MSTFSRLIDMASKAIDKKSGTPASQGSGDWRGMVRGAADALTGEARGGSRPSTTPPPATPSTNAPATADDRAASLAPATADDRAAIARYDYLMRTADPETVEQIHRESFERLTPQQRAQVEERMRAELAPHERPASSSAADLARSAGRSEAARPGRMRRLLAGVGGRGRGGAGVGMDGAIGGAGIGLLGAVAGGAVLSAVAAPLLAQAADLGVDFGALAEGVDLGALAEGVDVGELASGAEGLVADAGEQVSGIGEQLGGVGEQLGGIELPSFRDLLG